MLIRQVIDDTLAQYAFLIGCQQTGEALVVDPERDVDRYLDLAARENLRIVAVAETHIHADFLSGARELTALIPDVRVYLSAEGGDAWRYEWPIADHANVTWLHDGTTFRIGYVELRAWHTPGHTPEHMAFVVTDHGAGAADPIGLLSGDFVFAGDLGRPDLLESAAGITGMMKPSARQLYQSVQGFLKLPDFVQVWPGHGAGSACGKALGAVPMTTVGYERRISPALAASTRGEQAFVEYILADQPEPPFYFADMKRLNKVGPPVLRTLPTPRLMATRELAALVGRAETQIIDTRPDRRAFFAGHVPGALYAPFDRTFPTVVGSLLDPRQPIVLLIAESQLDVAVRMLIRIGYDHIAGWAPVSIIDDLQAAGMVLATTDSIDFGEFERRRSREPLVVLDVRTATEYHTRHVPDARNIAHTRLRAHDITVPGGPLIYVHCRSGARAAAAAAYLERRGASVVHVDGDFAAWQSAA